MKYQYEFDDAGNRTKMKYFDGSTTATTNYHYNDANQLYHSSRGSSDWYYTYDDNGNLTDEDTEGSYLRDFTWNDDNRLTYVDNIADDNEVEYTYDAMGRRIMRNDVDTNTWTKYYYDGLTVIAEKKKGGEEGAGIWDRIMTVAPGVIGNIFCISTWNGSSWDDAYYHYDAIGNVIMTSNSSGSMIYAIEQEAYGNVKVNSQSGYHLITKEYDSIPELYYFWQRCYDPLLGRFLSKSPFRPYIEHYYSLCNNNSSNIVDFAGLFFHAPTINDPYAPELNGDDTSCCEEKCLEEGSHAEGGCASAATELFAIVWNGALDHHAEQDYGMLMFHS